MNQPTIRMANRIPVKENEFYNRIIIRSNQTDQPDLFLPLLVNLNKDKNTRFKSNHSCFVVDEYLQTKSVPSLLKLTLLHLHVNLIYVKKIDPTTTLLSTLRIPKTISSFDLPMPLKETLMTNFARCEQHSFVHTKYIILYPHQFKIQKTAMPSLLCRRFLRWPFENNYLFKILFWY